MTKIKICGLRRPEDISYVNMYKPDFIGFVFAKSKRQVDISLAASLKSNLDKEIKSVGVFVNEEIKNIELLCKEKIIDIVQLHGDEDSQYIKELKDRVDSKIIKAVSVGDDFIVPNLDVDYFLFDTYNKSARGGTGESFNWDKIKNYNKPYFLAGGITVNNIADAINKLHPYCIDVSSGAETDGVKDKEKIQQLVFACHSRR